MNEYEHFQVILIVILIKHLKESKLWNVINEAHWGPEKLFYFAIRICCSNAPF